jgi:hypothetical protein
MGNPYETNKDLLLHWQGHLRTVNVTIWSTNSGRSTVTYIQDTHTRPGAWDHFTTLHRQGFELDGTMNNNNGSDNQKKGTSMVP